MKNVMRIDFENGCDWQAYISYNGKRVYIGNTNSKKMLSRQGSQNRLNSLVSMRHRKHYTKHTKGGAYDD